MFLKFLLSLSIISLPLLGNIKLPSYDYIPDTFVDVKTFTKKKITDIMDENNSCSLFFSNMVFCPKSSIKEKTVKLYLFNNENTEKIISLNIIDFVVEKEEERKEESKKNTMFFKKENISLIQNNKKLKKNIKMLLEKNSLKLKECTLNNTLALDNDRLKIEISKISNILKIERENVKAEHFRLISALNKEKNQNQNDKIKTLENKKILENTQISNLLSKNNLLEKNNKKLKLLNKKLTKLLKSKNIIIRKYKKLFDTKDINVNNEEKKTSEQNIFNSFKIKTSETPIIKSNQKDNTKIPEKELVPTEVESKSKGAFNAFKTN